MPREAPPSDPDSPAGQELTRAVADGYARSSEIAAVHGNPGTAEDLGDAAQSLGNPKA